MAMGVYSGADSGAYFWETVMLIENFPRLKPAVMPVIRPVPEYEATGRLKAVYESTKQGLGVPWMGVVSMAFARYPHFYSALWSALELLATTQLFQTACAELRATAESNAVVLQPTSLSDSLKAMGYAPAERDEVAATIAVFSSGNMPYVLMATLARLLLEGHAWDTSGEAGPLVSRASGAGVPARPVLMEAHHADPETQALYARMRTSLGLPFINTDYRALARWPSYFALAWDDLEPMLSSAAYVTATQSVHDKAAALVLSLPNLRGVSALDLQQAAAQDAPLEEVLGVVRLFQWLLPGLAINVAYLRGQLRTDER